MRISIDDAMMSTAILWSRRSHCKRRRVGCVISKDNRILSIGYNGNTPGADNCCEDDHGNSKPTIIHAEEAALGNCLRHGISPQDAIVYLTLSPCMHCASMMIYAGIKEVVYLEPYRILDGIEHLKAHNIKVRQLENL